jgi:hypothetical protein
MSARSVVVVMPFGGQDHIERRRAILNFKRLEYLVRNTCSVIPAIPASATDRVVYAVEVARTAMDDIPEKALQQIETADILIALVVERNPNVIYEIAYRQARDRSVGVLVVDSADNLPLYLKSLAYQSWKQDEVLALIDKIASDPSRDLNDFTVGIPDELKKFIDFYDGELQKGLERALQEIEAKIKPEQIKAVQYLRGIVSEETVTYYPCSIVEISFSRRGEFAHPQSAGIIQDFDDGFSRLYGYASKTQADTDRPLTLSKLLGRIEKFSDKSHWDDFMEEQVALTTTVISEYGFARAKVPLRFNEKHPQGEYRGKAFLPCLIAQVIDGNQDGPHNMYLLVIYIELPDTLRPGRSTT